MESKSQTEILCRIDILYNWIDTILNTIPKEHHSKELLNELQKRKESIMFTAPECLENRVIPIYNTVVKYMSPMLTTPPMEWQVKLSNILKDFKLPICD